jgi:hypothetical protein
MKRIAMAAGAAAGAAVLLTACSGSAIGPGERKDTTYTVGEAVSVLDVRSSSGDIQVVETARTGIQVTESMNWTGEPPKTSHSVSAGTLLLTYECGSGFMRRCGVDYKIEVPKGLRVKLDTGSGDIEARDVSGQLNAKTGSGDVEATRLGGKQAYAETGSGGVKIVYLSVPDDVEVKTGSGDAAVHVPQGAYKVEVSTGSGDETISVNNDPSSTRRIRVNTGSGDAEVLPG